MNQTENIRHPDFRPGLDRRRFLKLSGLAGGGMALGFFLGGGSAQAAHHKKSGTGVFSPNAFIQIKPDGTIILASTHPEIGQGVKTSLPMILAEELEAPWASVRVIFSHVDEAVFGRQSAGGSQSTPRNWTPLRQAGAIARTMLVAAAAKKWGVSAARCHADQGTVFHPDTGKSLTYGALVATAADLPVPTIDSITLKDRKDYKLLGRWIPGVDNRDLVTGKTRFGVDQKLPGMLFATYTKCPQFGGSVKAANLDTIKAMPGVKEAFILEAKGNSTHLRAGVAILADSTYSAFEANGRLRVDWDLTEASNENWEDHVRTAEEVSRQPGEVRTARGDFETALQGATKTIEAYYQYPFIAHATLEPQNCVTWWHDDTMEFWAPTQNFTSSPRRIARPLGITPEQVLIHQVRIGGGFGRRLLQDYMCEAGAIAKKVGVPVKLSWTREADMTYDFYRVGGFHRLTGALDNRGALVAYKNHFVTFTEGGEKPRPVRGGNYSSNMFPARLTPNVRIERTMLPSKIPAGLWRAPGDNATAWVTQSFAHELSTAAGKDHVAFLLELLGEPRYLGDEDPHTFHTGRAAEVIRTAAEKSGWGTPLPEGKGRGLAFGFSHQGYFAEVAEVTVEANKRLKVDRVIAVGDVGLIINRSGAENQVEGSIIDGLSAMMGQQITFTNGVVNETNFTNYPLLRMPAHPKIVVHFLETDYAPTGLGEPALPPVLPAICNAIFDATKTRVRSLPLTKEGFRI